MKSTLINILILISLVLVDQAFKYYFISNHQVHLNMGFIGGLLGDAPYFLRVVGLSTLGVSLICIYLVILSFNSWRMIQYSLSIVVSGILGNVIDRIRLGKSIDFIDIGTWSFNIADISLWMGSFLALYLITRYSHKIWFDGDLRNKKVVYPREQLRISTIISVLVFSTCLILGVTAYSYFKSLVKFQHDYIMNYFILIMVSIGFTLTSLVFYIGLIFSHKIAGPIYSLHRYVMSGKKKERLRLRENDYFKVIEKIADEIKKAE